MVNFTSETVPQRLQRRRRVPTRQRVADSLRARGGGTADDQDTATNFGCRLITRQRQR